VLQLVVDVDWFPSDKPSAVWKQQALCEFVGLPETVVGSSLMENKAVQWCLQEEHWTNPTGFVEKQMAQFAAALLRSNLDVQLVIGVDNESLLPRPLLHASPFGSAGRFDFEARVVAALQRGMAAGVFPPQSLRHFRLELTELTVAVADLVRLQTCGAGDGVAAGVVPAGCVESTTVPCTAADSGVATGITGAAAGAGADASAVATGGDAVGDRPTDDVCVLRVDCKTHEALRDFHVSNKELIARHGLLLVPIRTPSYPPAPVHLRDRNAVHATYPIPPPATVQRIDDSIVQFFIAAHRSTGTTPVRLSVADFARGCSVCPVTEEEAAADLARAFMQVVVDIHFPVAIRVSEPMARVVQPAWFKAPLAQPSEYSSTPFLSFESLWRRFGGGPRWRSLPLTEARLVLLAADPSFKAAESLADRSGITWDAVVTTAATEEPPRIFDGRMPLCMVADVGKLPGVAAADAIIGVLQRIWAGEPSDLTVVLVCDGHACALQHHGATTARVLRARGAAGTVHIFHARELGVAGPRLILLPDVAAACGASAEDAVALPAGGAWEDSPAVRMSGPLPRGFPTAPKAAASGDAASAAGFIAAEGLAAVDAREAFLRGHHPLTRQLLHAAPSVDYPRDIIARLRADLEDRAAALCKRSGVIQPEVVVVGRTAPASGLRTAVLRAVFDLARRPPAAAQAIRSFLPIIDHTQADALLKEVHRDVASAGAGFRVVHVVAVDGPLPNEMLRPVAARLLLVVLHPRVLGISGAPRDGTTRSVGPYLAQPEFEAAAAQLRNTIPEAAGAVDEVLRQARADADRFSIFRSVASLGILARGHNFRPVRDMVDAIFENKLLRPFFTHAAILDTFSCGQEVGSSEPSSLAKRWEAARAEARTAGVQHIVDMLPWRSRNPSLVHPLFSTLVLGEAVKRVHVPTRRAFPADATSRLLSVVAQCIRQLLQDGDETSVRQLLWTRSDGDDFAPLLAGLALRSRWDDAVVVVRSIIESVGVDRDLCAHSCVLLTRIHLAHAEVCLDALDSVSPADEEVALRAEFRDTWAAALVHARAAACGAARGDFSLLTAPADTERDSNRVPTCVPDDFWKALDKVAHPELVTACANVGFRLSKLRLLAAKRARGDVARVAGEHVSACAAALAALFRAFTHDRRERRALTRSKASAVAFSMQAEKRKYGSAAVLGAAAEALQQWEKISVPLIAEDTPAAAGGVDIGRPDEVDPRRVGSGVGRLVASAIPSSPRVVESAMTAGALAAQRLDDISSAAAWVPRPSPAEVSTPDPDTVRAAAGAGGAGAAAARGSARAVFEEREDDDDEEGFLMWGRPRAKGAGKR
jgi:hypothetical protein